MESSQLRVETILFYIFEKTPTALVWAERAIKKYKYTKKRVFKILAYHLENYKLSRR